MWMDWFGGGPGPKRGDLVQSNIGDRRRERTWLVLRSRLMRRRQSLIPRYELWMVRWWELEPETRMRLYRSAERAGGQQVIKMRRYPAKKRSSSEQEFFAAR